MSVVGVTMLGSSSKKIVPVLLPYLERPNNFVKRCAVSAIGTASRSQEGKAMTSTEELPLSRSWASNFPMRTRSHITVWLTVGESRHPAKFNPDFREVHLSDRAWGRMAEEDHPFYKCDDDREDRHDRSDRSVHLLPIVREVMGNVLTDCQFEVVELYFFRSMNQRRSPPRSTSPNSSLVNDCTKR